MSSYGFRIRFLLPGGQAIDYDGDTLNIPLPLRDRKALLKSVSKRNIKDSNNLAIHAGGFASKKEAGSYGNRVKKALLICGTALRIGIDVGKDKASSGAGKFLKDEAKKRGVQLLNDVHGLCIYPEDMPVKFMSLGGRLLVSMPASKFIQEFTKAYERNPKLSPKQSLALELYNMSHFESSLRARFLTLVSAVECLSYRNKRTKKELEHLQKLIELTENSELKEPQKESLLDGLGNLKRESISISCRNLVNKHLGNDDMTFFHECYSIRSIMVHEGKVPQGVNLGEYVPKLDQLVSSLVLADIK